jgi:hypothetical protein
MASEVVTTRRLVTSVHQDFRHVCNVERLYWHVSGASVATERFLMAIRDSRRMKSSGRSRSEKKAGMAYYSQTGKFTE